MDSVDNIGSTPFVTENYSVAEDERCLEWYYRIIMVFNWAVFPLGLVGNVLTIIIMSKDWRRSATHLLLSYLALADIMTLLAYSGVILGAPYLRVYGSPSDLKRLITFSLQYTTNTGIIFNQMSILVTVLVTWQRYISVCMPHKVKQYGSKRFIHLAVISSALMSIILYLPNYFQYKMTTENGQTVLIRADFADTKAFTILYTVFISYLSNYFIPIALLIYMAARLIKVMWQRSKTHKGLKKAKEDLTLSVIVVVVIFIICQSIGPIRRILQWVYDPYDEAIQCGGDLMYFAYIPILSQVINTSANFVVYILFARGFRKSLAKLFAKKNNANGEHNSTNISVNQVGPSDILT